MLSLLQLFHAAIADVQVDVGRAHLKNSRYVDVLSELFSLRIHNLTLVKKP